MPVRALCTAESYDLVGLVSVLRKWYAISNLNYENFVHVQSGSGNDAFIFRNGSFVVWGSQDDCASPENHLDNTINELKGAIRPFELSSLPIDRIEEEDMLWREGEPGSKTKIVSDNIFQIPMQNQSNTIDCIWSKLALSNGLSDSVKLAVLEGLLDNHVEKIKGIPIVLEKGRRIPIGRAATLRLIGELLHFRAALNLDSEFLNTPEIYWSQPELEELYKNMIRSLDKNLRIAVLNKKIDYAENIAELLRSHLNESHMFRLEWAIVILVGFEVVNSILWWFV